jgi:hypothetical protein
MSFNPNDFLNNDNNLSENQLEQLNQIYVKKNGNDTIFGNISFNGGINLNSSISTNQKIISETELSQLDNINSNIQTQLNSYTSNNNTYVGLNSFTNDTTLNNTIMTGNLIANGININPGELSQLNNVSSNIQSQLNNKINLISNSNDNSIPQLNIDGSLKNTNNITITNDISLNSVSSTIIPSSNAIKQYIDNKIDSLDLHQNIGMGSINYYFTNNSSGVNGYEILSTIPDSNSDIEIVTAQNSETLLHGYITQNLNRTIINSGVWNFSIFANVDDSSSFSYFKFKLFTRTTAGVETMFLEAITNDINVLFPNVNEYIASATLYNDVNLFLTDNIVVKVYFGTTVTNKIITGRFYHGNTNNSYIQSSFLNKHNQLSGLNEGDYKHLTNQEYINCTTIANINSTGLLSNTNFNTFNNKQDFINTGSNNQFYRGDKTFVELTKNNVNLNNVDNTSDLNKPISNLTQSALDNKQNIINNTVDILCKSISDISGNLRTELNNIIGPYSKFLNIIYVNYQFGNDLNNGYTILYPKKTISNCLSIQQISSGMVLLVSPFQYIETNPLTITAQNLSITGMNGDNSGLSYFNFGLTINSFGSVRLSNLNLTSLYHSGSGSLYLNNCKISNSLDKSGNGYLEINDCNITGPINISSTSANINIRNCNIPSPISITGNNNFINMKDNLLLGPISQNLNNTSQIGISNSIVYSASALTYGITSSNLSLLSLNNVSILNPDNTPGKINIGYYLILNNCYFDRANSLLTNEQILYTNYFGNIDCKDVKIRGNIIDNNNNNINISYLVGLTSNIQSQLNNKYTSGYSLNINNGNLLTLNGNLNVNSINITPTILSYLDGVTSNIQNQINNTVSLSTIQTITGNKTLNCNIFVNGLTLTPIILSYLGGVTSDIQTQINSKQNTINNTTNLSVNSISTPTGNLQTQIDNTNLNIVKNNVTNYFTGNQFFEKIYCNSPIGEIYTTDIRVENLLNLSNNGIIKFRNNSIDYSLYNTDLFNLLNTTSNIQTQLDNTVKLNNNQIINGDKRFSGTTFLSYINDRVNLECASSGSVTYIDVHSNSSFVTDYDARIITNPSNSNQSGGCELIFDAKKIFITNFHRPCVTFNNFTGRTISINEFINKNLTSINNDNNYVKDTLQFRAFMSGFYNISVMLQITDTGNICNISLYKNDAFTNSYFASNDGSNRRHFSFNTMMFLNTNDYIYFKNNVNSNYTIENLYMSFNLVSV